jgi:hypothetical protein
MMQGWTRWPSKKSQDPLCIFFPRKIETLASRERRISPCLGSVEYSTYQNVFSYNNQDYPQITLYTFPVTYIPLPYHDLHKLPLQAQYLIQPTNGNLAIMSNIVSPNPQRPAAVSNSSNSSVQLEDKMSNVNIASTFTTPGEFGVLQGVRLQDSADEITQGMRRRCLFAKWVVWHSSCLRSTPAAHP